MKKSALQANSFLVALMTAALSQVAPIGASAQGLQMSRAHVFPVLKASGVAVAVTVAATPAVSNRVAVAEVSADSKVRYSKRVTLTAYNSLVGQTDSTPCITANGYDLCKHDTENVVAANFLRFGTKIRIPEYFGDRVFTVQDRMNARYTECACRVDIWMREYADARQFGARNLKIEVLE